MKKTLFLTVFLFLSVATTSVYSQHFGATASISGNNILFKITPIGGSITCGWSDIEFFLRNSTSAPDPVFSTPAITVNTTDFPGVVITYNGMNQQGSEINFDNYWFGVSFAATAPKTYNVGQEYTVCTIALGAAPGSFGLQLVHNENFSPTYLALTDQGSLDRSAPTGNKFYGAGATICACPVTTTGMNHILPLSGPLPVELTVFKAEKTGHRQATLQWVTTSERLFAAFDVECKSATADWHFLGSLPAAGANGGASYHFIDKAAPLGRAYYRLKLVDKTGAFRYSPMQTLLFEDQAAVAVYPNPASDKLFMELQGDFPEETPVEITLWDAQGLLVVTQKSTVVPGQIITLPLAGQAVPSGSYLLRIKSEQGLNYATRVVVQKKD